MQETDHDTDSTQENDVQTTTIQKTDSKPIQESGYFNKEENGKKENPGMAPENTQTKTSDKTSVGSNDDVLKTSSECIKESDHTADTADQYNADQGVSTGEEKTKPEANQQTKAEDNLRQEHEEESNQQTKTAKSDDLEQEEATNSMDTEEQGRDSAEGASDEKYETEKGEKDDDDDGEEGSDGNSEDGKSQLCSGSEDEGSNISEESKTKSSKKRLSGPGSSKLKRQKKKERKERKKLNNESPETSNAQGDKKSTSDTKRTKNKGAQNSTKVKDGATGSKVFGSAGEMQTNVDSGVSEPLEKPSFFGQKKSTQTPATKSKKEQVCTFYLEIRKLS